MSEVKIPCGNCGKEARLIKIPEYQLDTVGLSHVWLLEIDGYKCSHCGDEGIILPCFGLLMQRIAEAILFKNSPYTAEEICFQKNFFNLTGKYIAKNVGASEKTVSFWMTGKTAVSPVFGIKLRKLFTEEYLKHLDKLIDNEKEIVSKVKELVKDIKKSANENQLLRILKERAQESVQQKINEAIRFSSSDGEAPMIRLPDSKGFVQLRLN